MIILKIEEKTLCFSYDIIAMIKVRNLSLSLNVIYITHKHK
jgi:hypothetical protein